MKVIFFAAVSLSVASAALLPQQSLVAPRQAVFQPQYQQPRQVFIQPQPQPQYQQFRQSGEAAARILRNDATINPDGSYAYAYETENGIAAQEQGQPKAFNNQQVGEAVQGSFQYTSPEGIPIQLQYVADENGFQPQGSHLPTVRRHFIPFQRFYIKPHILG